MRRRRSTNNSKQLVPISIFRPFLFNTQSSRSMVYITYSVLKLLHWLTISSGFQRFSKSMCFLGTLHSSSAKSTRCSKIVSMRGPWHWVLYIMTSKLNTAIWSRGSWESWKGNIKGTIVSCNIGTYTQTYYATLASRYYFTDRESISRTNICAPSF